MTVKAPLAIFWDCDGVLANNSEALAMPIAGIILNEAVSALHPDAPQFDIKNFTEKYAGGHFSQFYQLAEDMLRTFDPTLQLPPVEELDKLKVERTVEVLTEKARPPKGMGQALNRLKAAGLKQYVVSSSELNRVIPCVEKIAGFDFGGALEPGGKGGFVISAVDTIKKLFGYPKVKPAPNVAWVAMLAAGISDPKDAMAVEDSASGVTCWVNAGIPVVGYVGGDHIKDKEAHAKMLMEEGAVAVFHTMKEVSDYIVSLQQPAAVPNTGKQFSVVANPK